MARLSVNLTCPACGESMKVSKAQKSQKVCCPHCRQNVELDPPKDEKPEPHWSLPSASLQLEEILAQCRDKRLLLKSTQAELEHLEAQARSLGEWLRQQEPPSEDLRSNCAMVDLQIRLFDQLLTLKKGHVVIQDCDSNNERSLARAIKLTFEAFAWTVDFSACEIAPTSWEEITFVVAPGPVSYPVAAVYIAFQSSGFRLRSEIDPEQNGECARFRVHRISKIPKVLPAPRSWPASAPAQDFKKSA